LHSGSGANEGTEGEDGEVDDADEDEGEVGEDGEMDESGAEAAPSMPPLSSSEAVERPAATRTPVVGRRGDASEVSLDRDYRDERDPGLYHIAHQSPEHS
jgi:hypothetical protein